MNYMDQTGQDRLHDLGQAEEIFGRRPKPALPEQDPALVSIGDMLLVLRRGKWIIAACLIACLAAASLYLSTTAPEYLASSQVILEPHRVSVPQEATAGFATALDSAQAESQMQVIKSERILSIVFDTLDLGNTPEFAHMRPGLRQRLSEGLARALPPLRPFLIADPAPGRGEQQSKAFQAFTDRVTVRRIGQSYVLEISYQAPSPAQAARLTNSITAAYLHDQIEQKAAAARRGAEFLEDRISILKQEQDAATQAIRDGTIPSIRLPDSDARVISAAREPLGKSYPQTLLVLIFATVSGLLSGCGILAVRQSLDRTIRSPSQIWRFFGLHCLSVIPQTRRRGRNRLAFDLVTADTNGAFAQALRSAYTSVVTIGTPEASHRSIGVVSWRANEGKSTLAGNLAHFIAAAGEKAVLIDADLKDSTLSEVLAPEAASGLCDALVDQADLGHLTGLPLRRDLSFVPARGRTDAAAPNIFLGTPRVGRFLRHFRESSNVVVDLPAMAHSSHAQAICGFLDCVILVVECGRTTVEEVAMAIRTLEGARANLAGVILNKGVTPLGS